MIYWCVPVTYILVCANFGKFVYVCVSVCDCVIMVDFPLFHFKLSLGCLFSPHHVNQGGVQRIPLKSFFTSSTLLKSLSVDTELAVCTCMLKVKLTNLPSPNAVRKESSRHGGVTHLSVHIWGLSGKEI